MGAEVSVESPVYVYQWAVTRGILRFTDGTITGPYFSRTRQYSQVFTRHWTRDLAEAEREYVAAIEKRIKGAERTAAKLRKVLTKPVPMKDMTP